MKRSSYRQISDFDEKAAQLIKGGTREFFVNIWAEKRGCPVQKFTGDPNLTRQEAVIKANCFGAQSSYRVVYRVRVMLKRRVQP